MFVKVGSMSRGKILLVLLAMSAYQCLAAPSKKPIPLLHCLGREELQLHQHKTLGPVYLLNQKFISSVTAIGDFSIRRKHLKKICHDKNFSPSLKLLHLFLLHGIDLIDTDKVKNDQLKKLKIIAIEDLAGKIPHLFFSYLSRLQGLTPLAGCLNHHIPEIDFFLNKFKYLESEMQVQDLISEKKKINSIFKKLNNLDYYLDQCHKIARRSKGKRKS